MTVEELKNALNIVSEENGGMQVKIDYFDGKCAHSLDIECLLFGGYKKRIDGKPPVPERLIIVAKSLEGENNAC